MERIKQLRFVALRIIAVLLLCSLPCLAIAQVCSTVSVNSATTPVQILKPVKPHVRGKWLVKPDSAAAVPIMVQYYYGTLPTSMPSACASPTTTLAPGCMELTANQPMDSSVVCDVFGFCDQDMPDGLYAVLKTGVTAVTVYSCDTP